VQPVASNFLINFCASLSLISRPTQRD